MTIRRRLFALAPVLALFPLFPSNPPPPPPSSYPCAITNGEVVVTACGDVSTSNDTSAIQRANDTIAAEGGGRVVFPAGTYQARDVKQNSSVEFLGQAGSASTVIQRVENSSASPVIGSRIYETYGSVAANGTALTVNNATGVVPGAIVGIRGAGGGAPNQFAGLKAGMSAGQEYFIAKWATDFPMYGTNYLLIDNEMISYARISRLLDGSYYVSGLKRGLFGTYASSHGAGTLAFQLQRLYARVVSVSGNTAVLDAPAPRGVVNAPVAIGTTNVSIRGLALEGNPSSGVSHPVVLYPLANAASVTDSVIRAGNRMGVMLTRGTRGALVERNAFEHNGRAAVSSGVWIYNQARDNIVRSNTFDEDYSAVAVDDRTTLASEWDGGANGNLIEQNTLRVARTPSWTDFNTGILIEGSDNNVVRNNVITGPNPGDPSVLGPQHGIYVAVNRVQATQPIDSQNNLVANNSFTGNRSGVFVSGSRNSVVGNSIGASEVQPIQDWGVENHFDANTCTDAGGNVIACTPGS